jgi:hypothetical protein
MDHPDLIELSKGYVVKLVPDSHHGGFRARLINPIGGVNLEPHASDKISAIYQLIKELQQGFSIGDISLASDLDEALEKHLAKAVQGDPPLAGSQAHHRAEAKKLTIGGGFESKFKAYMKKKGNTPVLGNKAHEALAELILGDVSYVKKYKMPKWNVTVDMLHEPKVAIRYNTSVGIPTSKSAHAQRQQHFVKLKLALNKEWNRLADAASKLYGEHGSLISGSYREHFPDAVKDRLRFLAQAEGIVGSAVHLHHHLSKTTSPLFS